MARWACPPKVLAYIPTFGFHTVTSAMHAEAEWRVEKHLHSAVDSPALPLPLSPPICPTGHPWWIAKHAKHSSLAGCERSLYGLDIKAGVARVIKTRQSWASVALIWVFANILMHRRGGIKHLCQVSNLLFFFRSFSLLFQLWNIAQVGDAWQCQVVCCCAKAL